MNDELERLARLEGKVDSIQTELTEFKRDFNREFTGHKHDDDRNFKLLNEDIHKTQLTQMEIKTEIRTRFKMWGIILAAIPIIIAVINYFGGK